LPALLVLRDERGNKLNDLFLLAARETRDILKDFLHFARWSNKGCDTRLIQDYLGHKNIAHTVRYTRTAAVRFEGLWR